MQDRIRDAGKLNDLGVDQDKLRYNEAVKRWRRKRGEWEWEWDGGRGEGRGEENETFFFFFPCSTEYRERVGFWEANRRHSRDFAYILIFLFPCVRGIVQVHEVYLHSDSISTVFPIERKCIGSPMVSSSLLSTLRLLCSSFISACKNHTSRGLEQVKLLQGMISTSGFLFTSTFRVERFLSPSIQQRGRSNRGS